MGTIQFDDVSLRFAGGARPAVNRVTCQVNSGEIVVSLGPSGCGK
ncbi:ABC transporter ATP-binding protein, partial [filamentous cyanobacterium CCP4]